MNLLFEEDSQAINKIIDDVTSGKAYVLQDNQITSPDALSTYKTFSDGIKYHGIVALGTFYVKCAYYEGTYEGVASTWVTKNSDVEQLTLSSCTKIYYPSSGTLVTVSSLYVKKTGDIPMDGNISETDSFFVGY